jgi:Type IV secretion system pilin
MNNTLFGLALVLLLPLVTFAQTSENLTTVFGKIFTFALAFVWFLWNMFQFFFNSSEVKSTEVRDKIMYSVIGLFVMLSIWGLVSLFQNSIGIHTTEQLDYPSVQQNNSGSSFNGQTL